MFKTHENEREITESTATQFIPAKDDEGHRYYCLATDLKDPEHLTEEEKKHCIEDVVE